MYNIDWSKIKNGSNGFEEMAREYVKEVFSFPYGDWIETPVTHDGNKDAYTIIIGFHPYELENEVWWMEAKYSTERVYLSRFKLDATIVSSIFNRSVKKIIFVTNIDIKAKVISDVRVALYNGTSCKEAHFCTKKTIEFWLHKNPSIYKKFFNGALPIPSVSNNLFVSEDITIYSTLNQMRDVTPLYSILTNKLYEAHFKIVSDSNQIIKISSAQKGIKRLSDASIDVQTGENILAVQFKIEDKFFSYKKRSIDGIEENNLCFFKINKSIPVMVQYPIDILKNEKTQLKIKSQIILGNDLIKYKIRQRASYWLVDGTAGCGKTTLIQRCVEEKALQNINQRYIKFTNNDDANNLELVSILFFTTFPYMYMQDITTEYLQSLNINHDLEKLLYGFKKNVANEHDLFCYLDILIDKEIKLFPDGLQINPKIIVLDDIQLLNDNSIRLLFFILENAQEFPIIFILASHSYFLDNSIFKSFRSKLAFEQYHLELTVNDIIDNMEALFSFTFDISYSLIEYFFPNIIVFNIYVNYVKELREEINSLDDFILTYVTFKQNYMSNEYINRQFTLISEKYPTTWIVCQTIYNQGNGIPVTNNNINEVGHLLKYGLIKYNEFNNVIPINEIYIIHYRKKYVAISDDKNPIEHMIWKLTNMLLPNELQSYYEKIHMMRNNEEFQTVNYILETVFENSSLDIYRKTWGEEIFYLLFFEYTYAAINCNTMITGYDNLSYIYSNIKGTSSKKLRLLLLEVIFELINCDYNNGKYSNCKKYYETFNNHFSALAKKGDIDKDCTKNLFWVLSKGYMLLIDSEEGNVDALENAEKHREFLLEKYPFHYIDFCRLLSKTLYTKDWDLACQWQCLAYNAVLKRNASDSKQALKVEFSFSFTQYLNTADTNYLDKMQEQLAIAKHKIYSSYRHQLFLYCALLYILDNIDEADTLFIRDVISLRPIRKKMKGHFYLLLSLHFLKHKNIKEAKKNIEKSIDVLEGLQTYQYIALHNKLVLKNVSLENIQVQFCLSDSLNPNIFYLDPRM